MATGDDCTSPVKGHWRVLDINPDIVCRLIELAREFHAQEEVVIPEIVGIPRGDWAAQTLAGHLDDMTLQEFKSIVRDLEPGQKHQVVALFWVAGGILMLMRGRRVGTSK